MIVSVVLHIPVWSVCLRIVDIKKNGGKIRDIWRSKLVDEEILPAEDCVGEFEDDDVKVEREKVLSMSSTTNIDLQPVVIVKVSEKLIKKIINENSYFFSESTKRVQAKRKFLHISMLFPSRTIKDSSSCSLSLAIS